MARPAVSIEALRERIRQLEGAGRLQVQLSPSGVAPLDALLGGLPTPGVVELSGAPGTGRTRVALSLVAEVTRRRRQPVAWVDLERWLNPEAAAAHGVVLSRLLVVRPTADRLGWAVEQLARSGCFPLVVVADPHQVGRAGQRWARAVETGHCTLVSLSQHVHRDLPASVRVAVGEDLLTVVRNRAGRVGRSEPLPPWPPGRAPWAA